MEKVHEQLKKQHGKGHNSASTVEQLKEHVARYVQCDQRSQELSDERTEIREKVADLGLDTKAFQDAVNRAKKDRRKKEGYDESMKVMTDVLGDMNQDDLFAYLDKRERAKEEERAAKAKEREKANKEAKAANEKEKKVTGKDAAAGEGLTTGEAQAQAIMSAGNGDKAQKSVN